MKNNLYRTLSIAESRVVLTLEWEDKHLVTRKEIINLLDGNYKLADKVIRRLRNKRWIEQITPGKYILISADRGPSGVPQANMLSIGSKMTRPYYFAYATAASYHQLTTQMRSRIWVATRRAIRPRTIRNITFSFVTLPRENFFGYKSFTVFGSEVNISDLEKTVLDCVDKMKKARGIGEVTRIILAASTDLNWNKLIDYAFRLGSVAVVQRFGYLADRAHIQIPTKFRKRLRSVLKRNTRSYLGSLKVWGSRAKYNREWQLLINVPQREILSEI